MDIKRIIDIVGSSFGLIVFSPILLIVYILIRRQMGAPVLFRQVRPGKDGKQFEMVKFRSMRNATNELGEPLPDEERITALGNKLRSTSLDEIPGLWNVLKGDMSLVGPRPLLMEYVPLYSAHQAQRQEVRPGITGWAQINGRNSLSWEDKFSLDVWYVCNRTTLLDLKIIFKTVFKVFKRDGINDPNDLPMPKFEGTDSRAEVSANDM